MIWRGSDRNRFEALMRPHFPALYIAAQRLTLSAADAEDLVQDVCLRAYQHLEDLERVEFPKAWLLKTLYHRFVDTQRSRERSPVDMAETGFDSHEPERMIGAGSRPDDIAEQDMHLDRIFRAMGILGKEAASLLALHDIEGFSLEELREVTGLPITTIKSRLYRTRSKLGRLLSSEALQRPVLTVVGGKK